MLESPRYVCLRGSQYSCGLDEHRLSVQSKQKSKIAL
jgi:hypothetical protein